MREIWWKNLKQWSSWNHILTSLNFWDVLLNRQTKTEYLPLNRSFCCMSRNAFCKGIFDLFLLTRPLHIFSAFEKPRIVFVRFLQKYWPWLGYSFIFFRAFFFFFLESKISFKCSISSEELLVLIEYVPFGDLLGDLTRISNHKQIWLHSSWGSLPSKLLMEWVTCPQKSVS